MQESSLRKLHVAVLVALVFSAPVVANAARSSLPAGENGIHVSYSDLNLDSNSGISVLYQRLQNASNVACNAGPYQDKGTVREAVNARACYNEVLARSVVKVGNDKLTAYHES